MDKEKEFYKDKSEYRGVFTHVEENIGDPALQKTDDLYGAADVLSIRNAVKYQKILLALSLTGTLLALSFLLYDEVYWYGMIVACGVLLLVLFLIRRVAGHLGCHQKYLEYRLLAEGARVQYFLQKAGIRKNVVELLPWAWQFNVPWTGKVFETLMPEDARNGSLPAKSPVLDIWVLGQKEYHKDALRRAEARIRQNDRLVQASFLLAILTYAAALIFEITAGGLFSGKVLLSADLMNHIRMLLKVLMGTFSAMTLFAGNYYGRLSLEDTAQDHIRMIALYEKAEKEILSSGETEELLVSLAREELSENSNWYAYQSKNRPVISL